MSPVSVSVIIVSRGRPAALCRCLDAVSQLIYHLFEVVVVADKAGTAAAYGLPISDRITIAQFDEPNISVARNLGISMAKGDIVAFLDDDSVPEPGWLFHLMQAFSNASVVAAGGFVRGANGISYQWRGQTIDRFGYSHDLRIDATESQILTGTPGRAIKTQGTNCAFRRKVIARIGGFDPAFRYYLDETDVNMRLAKLGLQTAIVPQAEVHHSTAASDIREASRMPKSLFEIGASQMMFLRKYAEANQIPQVAAEFLASHRLALLKHMTAGNCEPRDVNTMLDTLQAGLADGARRTITPLPAIPESKCRFEPFHQSAYSPTHRIVHGYRIQSPLLRRAVRDAAARGDIVSLYIFSRTSRFHRVVYRQGCWEQTGGLFGKSERTEPVFRLTTLKQRLKKETQRVAAQRDPLNPAHSSG